MFSFKRNKRWSGTVLTSIFLLILQFCWIYRTYQLEQQQLFAYIEKAFEEAYRKEQTYRVPVVDIVNPGSVTIESCGNEEVLIIRQCPEPDTIIYNNLSGHSIDRFINRVFGDLRAQIAPMNIYCMADLFAGLLHDADIPMAFVIERIKTDTGELLETSALPDKKQPNTKYSKTIHLTISDTESLQGIVQITPGIILRHITGTLIFTFCLVFVIITLIWLLFRTQSTRPDNEKTKQESHPTLHQTFRIGKYTFDPNKNELSGFDESIQLNKKENAILYALCMQHGNIVERQTLLHENWGSSGLIYSRSLDTYLTTLRKYLKKDTAVQIITIKGVGYKLVY